MKCTRRVWHREARAAPKVDDDTVSALCAEPIMATIINEVRTELVPWLRTELVAVADSQGRVLMTAGSDNARASAAEVGLMTGVIWTCLCRSDLASEKAGGGGQHYRQCGQLSPRDIGDASVLRPAGGGATRSGGP